jgi:uncharacterized membrane protein
MNNKITSNFAFFALAIIFLIQCIHYFNHTLDDPFISFRYADNLVAGKGLVYNEGERVEGFSNPIWTLLMALCAVVGLSGGELRLLWCAKILGIFFGLCTIYYLFFVSKKYFAEGINGPLSSMFLVFSPYFAFWCMSGLESSLYTFLFLISTTQLLKEGDLAPTGLASAIILLILCLTRPESIILFVPFALIKFIDIRRAGLEKPLTPLAVWAATFISCMIVLTIIRFAYYGDILPNTYYAKTYGGGLQFLNGFYYWFFGFGKVALYPILAVIIFIPIFIKEKNGSYAKLLAIFGVYSIFIIYSGGDWMPGYRFLAHLLPIMMVLLSFALTTLYDKLSKPGKYRFVVNTFLVVIALIAIYGQYKQYKFIHRHYHIFGSGFKGISSESMVMSDYLDFARELGEIANENDYVALGEAGLIPYISKVRIIDCFGLMDKHIGRLKGRLHYKFDAPYVLNREPECILLLGKIEEGELKSKFLYSKELYENGEFRRNYNLHTQKGQFILYKRKTENGNGT